MESSVKIFMCCHKEITLLPPYCTAIQGGAALNPPLPNMLSDCGKNGDISRKNREYCELTVQYYAWKNVDAQSYGFCHYRRFFAFGAKTKRPYLVSGTPSRERLARLLGDEGAMRDVLSDCDIAVTRAEDTGRTVREHYEKAPYHYARDLDLFVEVLKRLYPELKPYIDSYLASRKQYFCNMFIMDKKHFFEYCSMLFPALEEFDSKKELHGDFLSDRTDGYLGERFLGIYLAYAAANGAHIHEAARLDVLCPLKKRVLYRLLPPGSKRRGAVARIAVGMRGRGDGERK